MNIDLKRSVEKIEMPKAMQARIMENCCKKMEDREMERENKRKNFGKPLVAVASLALCICLTGVTALAVSGKLDGFFKDVTGWDGAVVGTTYEQATDEIEVRVAEVSDTLKLEITLLEPDGFPYAAIAQLGINAYQITDLEGNVIVKNGVAEGVEISDGKVVIYIPLAEVQGGSYQLKISEMVGTAKAEQPLPIKGEWVCEFVR